MGRQHQEVRCLHQLRGIWPFAKEAQARSHAMVRGKPGYLVAQGTVASQCQPGPLCGREHRERTDQAFQVLHRNQPPDEETKKISFRRANGLAHGGFIFSGNGRGQADVVGDGGEQRRRHSRTLRCRVRACFGIGDYCRAAAEHDAFEPPVPRRPIVPDRTAFGRHQHRSKAGQESRRQGPQLGRQRIGMHECIVPLAQQAGVGGQETRVETAALGQVMHGDAACANGIDQERVAAEVGELRLPMLPVQPVQQVLDLALAAANFHAVDHHEHAPPIMHGTAP